MVTRKEKEEKVKQLIEKLQKSEAIYLTDYQGLTHKELELLRHKIAEEKADYSVVKNTLFRIALKKANKPEAELVGPIAVLFAYKHPLKPLKTFTENFKERLKAGIAYGEYLTGKKLQLLVDLESEEVLQTKLASYLASPLYGLVYALNWNMQRLVIAVNEIKKMKDKQN